MRIQLETTVYRLAGRLTKEPDGSNLSYFEELEKHGYKKLLHRRKFHGSKVADRFGVYPADYWIFQRQS